MKKFLIVLSLLVAAAFALVACGRYAGKGPCCPGGAAATAPAMAKCADCPHKDNCACAKGEVCKECPKAPTCECAKGGPCTCPDGCKCAHCAKKAAVAGCACGKGADCKCVDCKCPHCTELKKGPVGAPEGAPKK